MNIEEKYEKVLDKLEEDYSSIVRDLLTKDKIDIINNAYAIAHYNEIVDVFDGLDEYSCLWDEELFDKILNTKENILIKVWDSWLNYSHPERYNFFCYEDLIDIIEYAILH